MTEPAIVNQARAIAALLPTLVRQLFAPLNDLTEELPLAQLRVCGVLYDGPRPMSSLGRELGVSLSAMTQLADRLERTGMVERVADGTDRRVRCLQLTLRGQEIMGARDEARTRRVLDVLKHLPPETREDVGTALELLARAAADSQPARLRRSGDGRGSGKLASSPS